VPLAHASHVLVPQTHAIHLPDWLSEEQAAAVLLQGLTADYLIHDVLPVLPGMRVAVLAAAGGVGRLLTRMLVHRGIQVLAVASSQQKQAICLAHGAEIAVGYDTWQKQATGCDIVFDSVGSTLLQSLEAVKEGGRVVLFGMSGGKFRPWIRLIFAEILRGAGGRSVDILDLAGATSTAGGSPVRAYQRGSRFAARYHRVFTEGRGKSASFAGEPGI
jgi:NADPH:quinone reductase-like Zn-dependent oxidoreductase